jgi:hypothetical protein
VSSRATITITTRGLPTGADADGVAAMLEAIATEAEHIVSTIGIPVETGRTRASTHVTVDHAARAVRVESRGTGYGAYVRRSDATTRMTRTDWRPNGGQKRKSVTIGTEIGRAMGLAIVDLAKRLPGNVALAVLAEVVEAGIAREAGRMGPRLPRRIARQRGIR